MRYRFDASSGGIKLTIPYDTNGNYQVRAEGVVIPPNDWDEALEQQGAITKTKGCGENRYIGIANILEFYLTPGCMVEVEPIDSIMAKVRMDWTMDEYFAEGGTTSFIDRLASSLGIEAYKIKVVAIYEGSVIVDFSIAADPPIIDPEMTPEEIAAAEAASLAAL